MRWAAAVPRPVRWLVGWWALLLVVLSVVYPVWRAPDEPQHVDMARWAGSTWGWPELRGRSVSRQVTESLPLAGVVDRSARASPPLSAPAPDLPPFSHVAPDEPTGVQQQMAQHPPLYYALVGRLAGLLPDGVRFDAEVTAMRLLSALLVVPLPLLAWAAARQVLDERAAVVAAVVSVSVPQLGHIAASVNNDALLVLLVAATTPLLLRVARDGGSTPVVVGAAALAGLACLTKGFGFFTPAWLVVAIVAGRRDVVRRSALALGVWFVAGGWWLARNVLVEGAIQPSAFGYPEPPPGFTVDLGWWIGFFWGRFAGRFWFEPDAVPEGAPAVAQPLMWLLLALVVGGFVVLRRRRGPRVAATAATPLAALVGLTVGGAFNYYRSVGAPWGIHGRYVFPALAAIGVLVAAAVGRWRWAPVVVFGVAVVLHGAMAWWALDRWWADLAALRAWSPLPWAIVVAAVVGLAVTTAGVATSLVATGWAGTPRRPRGGRR